MGHTDCTDVCEVVTDMLLATGFTKKQLELFDGENENHDTILEILGNVKMIRIDEQPNIYITAIETNVRALIKSHPDSKNFIETLRNEAIDQAFREISDRLDEIEKKLRD